MATEPSTDTLPALGQRPGTVAAADLIGNGFPELFVGQSGQGNNLAVFLNSNSWTASANTTATQTTLAASTNPSVFGQQVTFTATVAPTSGTGTPTGTVTFSDNGSQIGMGTLSGGQAMLMTSALIAGSHPITAQYGGDINFSTSTSSPALNQVVNPVGTVGTTTGLNSLVNPSVFGQTVTLTATVTPASGTTVPAGSVTFLDGGTSIGSGNLDNTGKATLQTATLSVSTHLLTAQYGGSASFSASVSSPALSEVVNKGGTSTAVGSS